MRRSTATLDGVASARRLDGFSERDLPYRWLCGGMSVSYHVLADFQVAHGALLKTLRTDSVAILHQSGGVDQERLTQDGMRVRASAGSSSFPPRAVSGESPWTDEAARRKAQVGPRGQSFE